MKDVTAFGDLVRSPLLEPHAEWITDLVGAVVWHVRKASSDAGAPSMSLDQRLEARAAATSRYPAQRQEA